jgi:hypothetical protein
MLPENGVILGGAAFQAKGRACPELNGEGISRESAAQRDLLWASPSTREGENSREDFAPHHSSKLPRLTFFL